MIKLLRYLIGGGITIDLRRFFERKLKMATKPIPRGIRNNNCGNIRYDPQVHWQGQCEEQTDGVFIQFKTPEYGIRAMAKLLRNYQILYNLESVQEIIGRWAPPNENDTVAYVKAVVDSMKVLPDEPLDLARPETLCSLITAIIRQENGEQPYTIEIIMRGISMAKTERKV